jgi:hypothetical protein
MSPTLAQLPGAARAAAGQSVSATQAVAEHLGPAGQFLIEPGNAAFVSAMRITTLAATVIAVLGALIVMRWLPGRPRPTIEELVAAEVAAAERDLAARRSPRRELSESYQER